MDHSLSYNQFKTLLIHDEDFRKKVWGFCRPEGDIVGAVKDITAGVTGGKIPEIKRVRTVMTLEWLKTQGLLIRLLEYVGLSETDAFHMGRGCLTLFAAKKLVDKALY